MPCQADNLLLGMLDGGTGMYADGWGAYIARLPRPYADVLEWISSSYASVGIKDRIGMVYAGVVVRDHMTI